MPDLIFFLHIPALGGSPTTSGTSHHKSFHHCMSTMRKGPSPALVPLCPCAPVPLCPCAPCALVARALCPVPLCPCAPPVPLCPCALVPLCPCAPVPLCPCALVPLCPSPPVPLWHHALSCPVPLCPFHPFPCAPVPLCPCALVPLCPCALVPLCPCALHLLCPYGIMPCPARVPLCPFHPLPLCPCACALCSFLSALMPHSLQCNMSYHRLRDEPQVRDPHIPSLLATPEHTGVAGRELWSALLPMKQS